MLERGRRDAAQAADPPTGLATSSLWELTDPRRLSGDEGATGPALRALPPTPPRLPADGVRRRCCTDVAEGVRVSLDRRGSCRRSCAAAAPGRMDAAIVVEAGPPTPAVAVPVAVVALRYRSAGRTSCRGGAASFAIVCLLGAYPAPLAPSPMGVTARRGCGRRGMASCSAAKGEGPPIPTLRSVGAG